jgi:hypothetical protein
MSYTLKAITVGRLREILFLLGMAEVRDQEALVL